MEDIKAIIAENIVQLRRKAGMTQIELAERLNYSDKAISKWERGESVPDIGVLKSIADMFGVTVDYLITAEHPQEDEIQEDPATAEEQIQKKKRMHVMVMGMSILLVWLIAAIIFIPIDIAVSDAKAHWLSFAYAIPVSMLVWLVFNATWFNRRRNYLIISLMMWSLITVLHLSLLMFGHNIWHFYLLGAPGQMIIILWSIIGKKN